MREHPLILCELQKENDDGSIDQKPAVCYRCQQQILDPAAYCCSRCDFFLHKRCAELPRQIRHPMHSQHDLVLLRNPSYSSGSCICSACGQHDWKFFTYHCSLCEFDLDVSCAILDQRQIKLDCHDHPLRQQRPATFYCSACKKVDEDSSYLCTICPFWIHKKCALLPTTVKHKDHDQDHNKSLLLAYSLPSDYRSFEQSCRVCWEKVRPSRWVYYCGPCRYFVHVTCVVISQKDEGQPSEDIEYPISGEQDQNVIKLPSSNAAQELIARFLLKEDAISSSNDSGKTNVPEEIFMDSQHSKHPLVLLEKVQNLDEIKSINSDDQEEAKALLVCDVCIEPMCSSDDLHYYACVECGYFVHLTCSKLPLELHISKHPQHPFSWMYNRNAAGLFGCVACRWWTNANYYNCEPCGLSICIKCVSASMMTSSVKHNGHKKHLLTQFQSSDPIECTACSCTCGDGFGFACEDCHFYVCYDCALLPPTTTQRWDKHPLLLIYPPYFEHPEEFYCVFCEKEINPNCWMYHCHECDYSLHPWCNPQIGRFRRVKFGRSLNVNNHSHPLTHVPEAQYKSFCGSCDNEKLDWKPAFQCVSCRFYLCPDCAIERELTDYEE